MDYLHKRRYTAPRYGKRVDTTCGSRRAFGTDRARDSWDFAGALLRIADVRPVSLSRLPSSRDRVGMAVVLSCGAKLETMAGGERCSSGGSRSSCTSSWPCVAGRDCWHWLFCASYHCRSDLWNPLRSVAAQPLVRLDTASLGNVEPHTYGQRLASAF